MTSLCLHPVETSLTPVSQRMPVTLLSAAARNPFRKIFLILFKLSRITGFIIYIARVATLIQTSIEGRQEPCPEDVFTLPITASFQINEYEFEGSSMSLVHDEGIDVMFTVRTNWHLCPFVNWTHLSNNMEALTAGETEEPEMTSFFVLPPSSFF